MAMTSRAKNTKMADKERATVRMKCFCSAAVFWSSADFWLAETKKKLRLTLYNLAVSQIRMSCVHLFIYQIKISFWKTNMNWVSWLTKCQVSKYCRAAFITHLYKTTQLKLFFLAHISNVTPNTRISIHAATTLHSSAHHIYTINAWH